MSLLQKIRELYLNNPALRAAGVPYNYSKHELDEIRKCKLDPVYFIRNYCKIVNPDKGEILFDMYPYQEQLVKDYVARRKNIVLSGRQMGKTSSLAAFVVWSIIFNKKYVVALLANKADTAMETLNQRVKPMYESLPKFLQQGVLKWDEKTIKLENGSRVLARSTAPSSIRGFTINCLIMDEFAHVEEGQALKFWTSAYPTISAGHTTKIIITSTPLGFNLFHKIYNDAEEKNNDFHPTKLTWEQVPGRDANWYKNEVSILGPELFEQEHMAEFIGSTNTLIPGQYIKLMSVCRPIHQKNGLSIYEYPVYGNKYIMIVDPSRGTGNDDSAFIIFDITEYPIRIVAKFKDNHISPLILPGVIEKLAIQYNKANVLVEINDNGQQVADILWRDLEYENTISFGFADSEGVGVRTTHPVKRLGCSTFKDMVVNQKLIVQDADLKQQIANFVQAKQGYEAAVGHKDDLVMCCVLLGWFMTTEDYQNWYDASFKTELQNQKQQMIEDDMLPFGFIFNGINDFDKDDFYK